MDQLWEDQEEVPCVACGNPVCGMDRGFAFGTEGVLCWKCAVARGGEYDAAEDNWTTTPDVAGLTVHHEWDE